MSRENIISTLEGGGSHALKLAAAILSAPREGPSDGEIERLARQVCERAMAGSRRGSFRGRDQVKRRVRPARIETPNPSEIRGFAIRFGVLSHPGLGGIREMIGPWAGLTTSLDRVFLTVDHQYHDPLEGVLELAWTDIGLMFRLRDIPEGSNAADARAKLAAGELRGCSFTGTDVGHLMQRDQEVVFYRHRDLNIVEIAICRAGGAYPQPACWVSDARIQHPDTIGSRVIWDLVAPSARWVVGNRSSTETPHQLEVAA